MACNIYLTLNGKQMPALGYGTWQSNDDSLEKAVDSALQAGYRHIDTAQGYGNEDIIGMVLKRWFDSERLTREDIFVTTKLSPYGMHPDKVEENMKESLRKLQLDYVDLYLIHFPVSIVRGDEETYAKQGVHFLDVWKKMEDQYDAGRAKSIGISNFNAKQVEKVLQNCRIKPACNQFEMHVYMQQRELVDYCTKNDITVVAYSPLGSRGADAFLERVGQSLEQVPNPLNDAIIGTIAKKHSKTPAQIMLRLLLQLGVSAIPKSVTPSRVKENISIFDFSLDNEDMTKLRALDKGPKGRIFDFKFFGRAVDDPEFPM